MFAQRRADIAANGRRFDEVFAGIEVALLTNPYEVSWPVDGTPLRILSTDANVDYGTPKLYIYFVIDGSCCELRWIEPVDPPVDDDIVF